MRHIKRRRFGLPMALALVMIAIVAALALGGFTKAEAAQTVPPPTGQLVIDGKTIPVLAWSHGASYSGTTHDGSGGGAGKVNFQDLSMTVPTGAYSADLLLKLAIGQRIQTAVLTSNSSKAGVTSTWTYALQDVLVTSLSNGNSGHGVATENLTLNFARVRWTYSDAAGSVSHGFDIPANARL